MSSGNRSGRGRGVRGRSTFKRAPAASREPVLVPNPVPDATITPLCWQCHHPITTTAGEHRRSTFLSRHSVATADKRAPALLFCPNCHALLPPSAQNHFVRLGLEELYALDDEVLEKHYIALQQQLHPDRFIGKSDREKSFSLRHTMDINEAYQVLKNPLRRAEYLLALHHIFVNKEEGYIKPSPALLMDVLQKRERLAEAATLKEVDTLEAEILKEKEEAMETMATCFVQKDYLQAAPWAIQLRYREKLLEEIQLKRIALKK